MMRSLYSGVSGMQNHQTRMDVIGNNIANVNTTGFKRGRVNFQDLLSQQMSGRGEAHRRARRREPQGSRPRHEHREHRHDPHPGVPPDHRRQTDVAIQGNGFFVMKGRDLLHPRRHLRPRQRRNARQSRKRHARPGLARQGYRRRTEVLQHLEPLRDLVIPIGSKDPAKATPSVDLACNLDKRRGDPRRRRRRDTRRRTPGASRSRSTTPSAEHIAPGRLPEVPAQHNRWRRRERRSRSRRGHQRGGRRRPAPRSPARTPSPRNSTTSAPCGASPTARARRRPRRGRSRPPRRFDVAGATADAGGGGRRGRPSTSTWARRLGCEHRHPVRRAQLDQGRSPRTATRWATWRRFKIDQSGVITGVYSNGTNRTIGQIALASFTNPGGLEKAGENTYVVSPTTRARPTSAPRASRARARSSRAPWRCPTWTWPSSSPT